MFVVIWNREGKTFLVTEKLEYDNVDHSEDLLSRLRGNVFHVTTQQAFEQIQSDGAIRNNKDGQLGINVCTGMSFGRYRGWVSLFDLREITEKTMQDTLTSYNFLGPSWFKVDNPDYSEYKLAYLFLNQEAIPQIIPNDFARQAHQNGEPYRKYVPRTECWYPGDIPLKYINKAILVTAQAPRRSDLILMQAWESLTADDLR